MKAKKLLLMLPFLFLVMGMMHGCEKGNNLEVFETIAKISYGEPATDGCGWKININGKEYHPTNLDDKFKINDLNINLKYSLLPSVWECPQWKSRTYEIIKIIRIIEIN